MPSGPDGVRSRPRAVWMPVPRAGARLDAGGRGPAGGVVAVGSAAAGTPVGRDSGRGRRGTALARVRACRGRVRDARRARWWRRRLAGCWRAGGAGGRAVPAQALQAVRAGPCRGASRGWFRRARCRRVGGVAQAVPAGGSGGPVAAPRPAGSGARGRLKGRAHPPGMGRAAPSRGGPLRWSGGHQSRVASHMLGWFSGCTAMLSPSRVA